MADLTAPPNAPGAAPEATTPVDHSSFSRKVFTPGGEEVSGDQTEPSHIETALPQKAEAPPERRGLSESQRLARVAKAERELAEREAALDGAQRMHEMMIASPQQRATVQAQNAVARFQAQASAHIRQNVDRYPLLAAYGDRAVGDVMRAHEAVVQRTGRIASHAEVAAAVEKLYADQLEPGRRALASRPAARIARGAASRRDNDTRPLTADDRMRRARALLRGRNGR